MAKACYCGASTAASTAFCATAGVSTGGLVSHSRVEYSLQRSSFVRGIETAGYRVESFRAICRRQRASTMTDLSAGDASSGRNRVELAMDEDPSAPPKTIPVPERYILENTHHLRSIDEYRQMYQRSIANPSLFWKEIAQNNFYWKHWPFDDGEENSTCTKSEQALLTSNFTPSEETPVFTKFAPGAKTNIAFNCLDRVVEQGHGSATAFIFEPNDLDDDASRIKMTYDQVLSKVKAFTAALRAVGVSKGDIVTVYMPMVPELPVAMLACARIGAVHSVVFGGFSAESLAGRILDAKSACVITCDAVFRGKKVIELKKTVDEAIRICKNPDRQRSRGSDAVAFDVDKVIVMERVGSSVARVDMIADRDIWWSDALAAADTSEYADHVEWVDAEHPLFVLYTSGSTGKPKGIQHSTGGYMVYTATTFKYTFNYHQGDVFFCTADCGWITGHSYVTYGPMLNGATQIIYEGVPNYPDAGRLWDIVDRYNVSVLYTAPTAIRALKRAGDDFVKKYSRKSLKILGSVGEPINPEAYMWYFSVVGNEKCPIVDTVSVFLRIDQK